MKIELKKITLLNFKGARSTEIEFGQITNVSGDNATGKTTIMDAFLWLLFGKDSTDRKDFEIKTLDKDNKPFHRMDHSVTAILLLDGQETIINRTFKEKWVKKKGESEAVFSGHETNFLWNDVPCSEKEFQSKVNEILNESIFKLITNTGYFNGLRWQERRNTLLAIAGEISNDDVIARIVTVHNKANFNDLITVLNSKKTIDEYRREIVAKKKKIKDELELIPARIEEASRSLPEEMDYESLQLQLEESHQTIASIDTLLMNKTKAQRQTQDTITNKNNEIHTLKSQRQQIEFETRNLVQEGRLTRSKEITNTRTELRTSQDDLARLNNDKNRLTVQKNTYEKEKVTLRKQWDELSANSFSEPAPLVFNEKDFCCPTCKRAYEAADIDGMKAAMVKNYDSHIASEKKLFNETKNRKLQQISASGKSIAAETVTIDSQLLTLQGDIENKSQEINSLQIKVRQLEENDQRMTSSEDIQFKNNIAAHIDYKAACEKIEVLENEIQSLTVSESNNELLSQKREANETISFLQKQLDTKEQKVKINARIDELTRQEKEMGIQLAELEGIEFSIEKFIKAKMDTLEGRINGMFKIVKFKLFDQQINGGTVETCEALINGVPYSDANNAARINAGIDIINTLQDFYDSYAPVFVDNAESVNTLIPVKSQLIRLVVTKDKKLLVQTTKQMAAAV